MNLEEWSPVLLGLFHRLTCSGATGQMMAAPVSNCCCVTDHNVQVSRLNGSLLLTLHYLSVALSQKFNEKLMYQMSPGSFAEAQSVSRCTCTAITCGPRTGPKSDFSQTVLMLPQCSWLFGLTFSYISCRLSHISGGGCATTTASTAAIPS